MSYPKNKFAELITAIEFRTATADEITELISSLGNSVNSFTFESKDIIENVKEIDASNHNSQGMTNLSLLAYNWIDSWASEKGKMYTDDRNEVSTKLCAELHDVIKEVEPVFEKSTKRAFENAAFRMHRTLVQQSTGLLMNALSETDKDVNRYLSENYEKDSIRLPMI